MITIFNLLEQLENEKVKVVSNKTIPINICLVLDVSGSTSQYFESKKHFLYIYFVSYLCRNCIFNYLFFYQKIYLNYFNFNSTKICFYCIIKKFDKIFFLYILL